MALPTKSAPPVQVTLVDPEPTPAPTPRRPDPTPRRETPRPTPKPEPQEKVIERARETPRATPTPRPTRTPKPRATPKATSTPKPTPKPTKTPKPTPKVRKTPAPPKPSPTPNRNMTREELERLREKYKVSSTGRPPARPTQKPSTSAKTEKVGSTSMKNDATDGLPGSYVANALKEFSRNFHVPPEEQRAVECVVKFRIQKDGTITSIQVSRSAGAKLDGYAVDAVKAASPLSPLPDGFPGRYTNREVTFSFQL